MVEIFIARVELMPADESEDQHQKRRKEENDIVEADKINDNLFKGCFSNIRHQANIRYDEEDRVHVCTNCGHEYEGGQECTSCGMDFEGDEEDIRDDFSDMEMDMYLGHPDLGSGEDIDDNDSLDYDEGIWEGPGLPPAFLANHILAHGFPHGFHGRPIPVDSSSGDESSNSDDNDVEEETQYDRDFIAPDSEDAHFHDRRARGTNSVSEGSFASELGNGENGSDESEDSDEGGAISNGRRRRQRSARRSNPSIITVSDDEDTSGAEDSVNRYQGEGWSPLHHGDDSDDGDVEPFVTASDLSDTDTMVGNQGSDDDASESHQRSRDNGSSTPRYNEFQEYRTHGYEHNDRYTRERSTPVSMSNGQGHDGSESGEDSDPEGNTTDVDGDVEMSVSPTASSSRGSSRSVEVLGVVNTVHDPDDDESEGSVRPPNRRMRPRRQARDASDTPEYNPRISQMFAQHQSDLRDVSARQNPLYEEWEISQRSEVTPRSRTAAYYRTIPPRHRSPGRNQAGSVTISVAERSGRAQRHYRRYPN
jgi:hypothetical protein